MTTSTSNVTTEASAFATNFCPQTLIRSTSIAINFAHSTTLDDEPENLRSSECKTSRSHCCDLHLPRKNIIKRSIMLEGKRSRGKQREKLIEGLTDWLKAGKSLEAIEATKDRKKWRTMIANAVIVKQGT
ncbi:hypothetical protein PoB_000220500 [Plakobranchus ocellatus]|uniref:Uncharacterized protein n=1 Tax=Plakobranchus ocellatus TaxID=259542 RepID=A0AAV3XZ34_9GAST|nr:hypothetical protein PoB_000220500 [Plakobranchus ocellatus]